MNIKDYVLFQKKELRQFCTYRLIFGISYGFMTPIISPYLKEVGLTTVVIGTVMSLYGVSKAIAQIPFGFISDKFGDKLTLLISLGIMSFIPFTYTLVDGKWLSGEIYILQGAVLGMAAPATFSILSRSLDEEKRGESTGLASAVFTLGGGIGAGIAGFIVSKLNNYNLVFYISSVSILLTTIFVFFKIKKSEINKDKNKNKKKENIKNRIKTIISEIKENKLSCKILLLGSIAFLGDFIFGCVGSIFPFYGQDVLGGTIGYTSAIISIYLFVFGIGAPIAGWVSDKVGNKKQLFLSFLVMNLTLLGLGFTKSIIIFTGIIIIYFVGATFLNASLQSVLSEFGENDKIKGIVFGFVGASEALGYAVGPIFSAFVYDFNKRWLFFGILIISAIISGIYLALCKKACIE